VASENVGALTQNVRTRFQSQEAPESVQQRLLELQQRQRDQMELERLEQERKKQEVDEGLERLRQQSLGETGFFDLPEEEAETKYASSSAPTSLLPLVGRDPNELPWPSSVVTASRLFEPEYESEPEPEPRPISKLVARPIRKPESSATPFFSLGRASSGPSSLGRARSGLSSLLSLGRASSLFGNKPTKARGEGRRKRKYRK
jgi:hypothetical protein